MGKKKKKSALFLCPGCGAFVSEDASKCTKCGQVLDSAPEPEPPEQVPEPEEPEPEARPETEAPTAESPQDSQPVTLFLCSACGAFTSGDAKVCPNCGASMGEEPETEPLIKPGDAEAELLDMLVQAEPGKHEPESLIDDLKKIESEEDVESFIKSIPEEEAELAPEPPPAVAGASLDEEDILGMLVSEGQEPEPTGPDVGRAKQQPDPEAGSPDEKPQRMHIDDNDTIALCASCGAFVSETAEVCNICGHRLKEGRLMARDRPQAQ